MFTIERAAPSVAWAREMKPWRSCAASPPGLLQRPPTTRPVHTPPPPNIFRKQGDSARALELYELAVEQAPIANRHVAAALAAMAEIYEERGEAELALELLKRALAARTGTPA